MVFSSFIENPDRTHYDGEDEDEHIKYVLRSSFIVNYKWIFLTLVMLVAPVFIDTFLSSFIYEGERLIKPGFIIVFDLFWYVATFGFFLVNFLLWQFNTYIVTSKKIVDMDFSGLFYKNISEATIDNIEDVTSTVRGTLGVVFNIGDVFIQTAAEVREFEFEGVHDPAKIRDLIADLVEETRKNYLHERGGEILLKDD